MPTNSAVSANPFCLSQPARRFIGIGDLAAAAGVSRAVVRAAIHRHQAARLAAESRHSDDMPVPQPEEGLFAVKAHGRWRIPVHAAWRYVDPAGFEIERALRHAERMTTHHALAEALDEPGRVADIRRAIAVLLPGVSVVAAPAQPSDERQRFEVWLVEDSVDGSVEGQGDDPAADSTSKRLFGTYGWTVGATLGRLHELAQAERLGRDLESLGFVRGSSFHDWSREVQVQAPDGRHWLISLPTTHQYDWQTPQERVAFEAWDYGLDVAVVVPLTVLGDPLALGAELARVQGGGLLSAEQAEQVRSRRAELIADPPLTYQ